LIKMFLNGFSNENQLMWIKTHETLIGELERFPESLYALRSAVGHIAWKARGESFTIPNIHHINKPALYYICERYRYDFRFRDLATILQDNKHILSNDCLLKSFMVYAMAGLKQPAFLPEWENEFIKLQSTVYPDERIASVLLHAMWFADKCQAQAEKMLELISFAQKRMNYNHHVFLYRKAFALRKSGRFDEAKDTIDLALMALDASETSFLSLHQDYSRERELAALGEDLNNFKSNLEAELRKQMTKELESAQRIVSDSMLKLIEILGLFIAIASVFLGSGAILSNNQMDAGAKLATLSILAASLIAFFTLLRSIIRFKR